MKKSINDALNKQINAEIYSAYLYLAMGAYFDGLGLDGFASWMKVQYEEEMFHAMKFYGFVYERGGKVTMEAIEKPSADFKSVLNVFEETLKHEQHVTSLINGLYDLAVKEKDYAFQSLLNWFIDEQVEEEDTAQKIIDKIKLAGEKGPGVYMLDQELGTRTFTPSIKGFMLTFGDLLEYRAWGTGGQDACRGRVAGVLMGVCRSGVVQSSC